MAGKTLTALLLIALVGLAFRGDAEPALAQAGDGGQPLAGVARKIARLGAKGAIRRNLAERFGLPNGADELWVYYLTPPWEEGHQRTIHVRPRPNSAQVDVLLIH